MFVLFVVVFVLLLLRVCVLWIVLCVLCVVVNCLLWSVVVVRVECWCLLKCC